MREPPVRPLDSGYARKMDRTRLYPGVWGHATVEPVDKRDRYRNGEASSGGRHDWARVQGASPVIGVPGDGIGHPATRAIESG